MEGSERMKEQLVDHLNGGEAFMPVTEMLREVPYEKLGVRPAGLPYSFYELFYHITYTQRDILNYFKEEDYKAPEWPQDYWPGQPAPGDEQHWENLQASYFRDRESISDFILSEERSLLDTVPGNEKHTFLRGILLVIEHTSYHAGQMLILLRHLGLHSS